MAAWRDLCQGRAHHASPCRFDPVVPTSAGQLTGRGASRRLRWGRTPLAPVHLARLELALRVCVLVFLPLLALASHGAAPLLVAAGACACGVVALRGTAAWRGIRGAALLLAVLVAWGLASAFWAVEPERSLLIAARLAALFALGLVLLAAAPALAAPERLVRWFAAGLVLSLALAAAQVATGGSLTEEFARRAFTEPNLNQVENGLALLLLPLAAMLWLRRRRRSAAALAAAAIVVFCVLGGDAGRLAFALGLAGAALLYWRRQAVARLAAAASVLMILGTPLMFPPLAANAAIHRAVFDIKYSAWHRLQIWSFVGARIAEHPWRGWGLDSSRAIPGGTTLTPEGRPWLPLHPHNAALQVWLELGLPGAALFALFVARLWLAFGAAQWPRLYAAAAGGSLIAALTIAFGSYGVWQEWWIASEFLALFLVLTMARLAAPA